MREIRPSGSEGGARSIPCPYPYRTAPEPEFSEALPPGTFCPLPTVKLVGTLQHEL